MKLRNPRVERKAQSTKITGNWVDEMRRPANVEIIVERGPDVPSSGLVIEGNEKDVAGILFSLADIAWGMGWRPRGLMAKVMATMESHRLPPEVR